MGKHQGCVLSPFLFAVVIDIAEFASVQMNETIQGVENKILKWK